MYQVYSPHSGLTVYKTRWVILAWWYELCRAEILERDYVDKRRAG